MNPIKGLILGVLVSVMLAAASAAAVQGPSLLVDVACEPESFQPREATAVLCTVDVSNAGDAAAEGLTLTLEPTRLSIPDVYLIQRLDEGQSRPVSPSDLSFSIGDLPAGSSRSGEIVAILWVAEEGSYGGQVAVGDAGGVAGGAAEVAFTASAAAAAPADDLQANLSLREAGSEEPAPFATYDITVTNAGEQDFTSLTLVDNLRPEFTVGASQPPGRVDDALGQVGWDLAAFGRESLAPGESLTASFTATPRAEAGCATAGNGIVAFAAFAGGGTGIYAALSETAAVGPQCQVGPGIGGGVPSVAELPRGGSDGYLTDGGSLRWPVLLGGLGAGLIALAGTILTFQSRLRGRRRSW